VQLKWGDIDFDALVIRVRSSTTKTRRSRMIGITLRFLQELQALFGVSNGTPNEFVFGGIRDVKRSVDTARRKAGIENLHFHDLRHLGTTRMIQAGMAPAEVMKITGHTRFETFARYLNVDSDGMRLANTARHCRRKRNKPQHQAVSLCNDAHRLRRLRIYAKLP